jgi:hypothetical protein
VFARKPSRLGLARAAALPVAALAAARDLDLLGVTADDTVLTIADPTGASLGIPLSTAMATDGDRILAEAAQMAIDGKLRIVIAADLPLGDAAKAMAQSETGHAQGKSVLHP